MMNVYIIGGSPCAGKSTAAKALSEKYDLYYFAVDDFLDEYIRRGAAMNYEICRKQIELSAEQIWMREPALQCREELRFYEEVSGFVLEELTQLSRDKAVITEGAAYLPCLMKKWQIPHNRYISITPAREFQISHFRQRDWIPCILEGCGDKEAAFANWMERDVLFARAVNQQCGELGYQSIINNGERPVEELVRMVEEHFHF